MFSISTVASSTRMPTASASPPSVITLSVWPSGLRIDDRREDRQRDRDHDDERAAPTAEKEQDHRGREQRGDDAFVHDAVDRRAHEDRLVEQLGHHETGRRRCAHSRKERLDLIDDVKRRRAAVFQNREQRGWAAVLANDVGLHGEAVAHVSDVADVNHRAVYLFDRNVIERGDGVGTAVDVDDEFGRADLRRAGRKREVLRVNRIADIER